jgi:hypothetical protein
MPIPVSNHAGMRRPRRVYLSRRVRYGAVIVVSLAVTLLSTWSLGARGQFDQRAARVAALTLSEKDRLLRNYDRFWALDRAEQQRLRRLDRQLRNDPRQVELRQIMQSYYQWMRSVPDRQRAELQNPTLDVEQRIARIHQLRAEQERHEADRADRAALTNWFQRQVFASLPEDARRQIEQLPPLERRLLAFYRMRQQGLSGLFDSLNPAALEELKSQASPRLRRQIDAARTPAEIAQLLRNRFAELPRPSAWGSGGAASDPEATRQSKQVLQDFFEHGLDDEERDRLLSLPPDEMYDQLRWSYLRAKFPDVVRPSRRPPYSPGRSRYRRPNAGRPAGKAP